MTTIKILHHNFINIFENMRPSPTLGRVVRVAARRGLAGPEGRAG